MVYDFTMEQDDYQAIDGLDQGARMYDPKYYKLILSYIPLFDLLNIS